MLTRAEYYKLIIFSAIVAVIIIIQYFISDALQRMSIPIINKLQSDKYLVTMAEYISELGSKKIKSFLVIALFSFCNLYHAFLYSIVTYISITLSSWLKILLQEPRPFWLDDSVKAYDCEAGYGYPSNHVLTTVPTFLMFFEILYYHFKIDRSVNANIFYWAGIGANILIIICVGFSRMILGVHSLDQVFFGLLMGFAAYYFYLHVMDYDIRNYHPFLQEISNTFYRARMIVIFVGIYLTFLLSIVFAKIYYLPIWTKRILNNCGVLPTLTPFYKCLADSGDYFVLLGIMAGIFYDIQVNYQLKYNTDKLPMQFIYENISDTILSSNNEYNRTGKWNDTTSLITTARIFFVYLVFTSIFIVSKIIYIYLNRNNLLTYFIFNKMIPCFLGGFFIFGFGKKLCYYLNLTNFSSTGEADKPKAI